MSQSIVDKLNRVLGGNPSARMVADDLQMTSELILLVRMMFADGTLKPEEMKIFKKICVDVFKIDDEDIPGVLEYLKDFGYETTAWDAASMFKNHDVERKKSLLLHMLEVAKADHQLDVGETEIIKRTAKILGLSAENLKS